MAEFGGNSLGRGPDTASGIPQASYSHEAAEKERANPLRENEVAFPHRGGGPDRLYLALPGTSFAPSQFRYRNFSGEQPAIIFGDVRARGFGF